MKAVFPLMRFQTTWEVTHFRAGVGIPMDQSDFVENMTMAYQKDPEAFREETRAAYTDLWIQYDLNMDCLIDSEELVKKGFEDMGYNDTHAELDFFKTFQKPGGIQVKEMVEVFTDFETSENKTQNDILDNFRDIF